MKPGAEPMRISEEALIRKIERFCDLQERSVLEVKSKLSSWKCSSEFKEKLIQRLIDEDRLNESRFATAYVRGKFRIKSWGRIKIAAHLRAFEVPPAIIREALEQIDEIEYYERLKNIIEKQSRLLKVTDQTQIDKIAIYAINKGYEPHLVFEVVKTLNK